MKKPTPKIYRATNCSAYNQALINCGNIAIWFHPKTQWYAQPQGVNKVEAKPIPIQQFSVASLNYI
jgi:hypothetical protein